MNNNTVRVSFIKIDNKKISEKFYVHLRSVHVLLEPLEYKTRDFYQSVIHKPHSNKNNNNFIKNHMCIQCGKKFVHVSTLKAHAVVHEPFPYICDCGIGFYVKQNLSRHKALVHSAEINQELKKLTSRQQRALINEIWMPNHIYKEVKKNSNDDKKASERLATNLETNEVRKKSKNLKLRAKSVSKTNGKKVGRRIYKVDNSDRPYPCEICGKRFTQCGTLKIHLKAHAGIKEYRCSFCAKEFLNIANLQIHERTHTGLKPYVCSYCKKAFSDPSAYKRHERTHTGVKPYSCETCGMRFSDASGRLVHEKRHTNQRDYKCEICDKRFITSGNLGKHYNAMHDLKKKFQCDLCSKSFALKSYLRIHIRNHSEFNVSKLSKKPLRLKQAKQVNK